MMTKVLTLLLTGCLLILTTACGSTPIDESSPATGQTGDITVSDTPTLQQDDVVAETPAEGEANILVAYFSCTNTTKPLAEYVADGLNADIYEIVPTVPYTSADLNYNDDNSRSSKEMNDPDSRPEISGSVENMEQYDIVFIGYPIWWGEAPRIVSTFMESYDFTGKTIIPFCTSSSSNIGSSGTNLEKLTDGAEWLSGKRFSGGTSREDMIEWVNSLGLDVAAQ